jgi:hypothetical protein
MTNMIKHYNHPSLLGKNVVYQSLIGVSLFVWEYFFQKSTTNPLTSKIA